MQNSAIVWKAAGASKALKGEVSLPNGSRLLPATCEVVLAGGEREKLGADDLVLPSGSIIRAKAPAELTASLGSGAGSQGAVSAAARFDYVPTAPINGRLRGVVELGASGFDMFIVRTDAYQNWKLEKAEYGASLVLENLATENDIRQGLKTYISKMLDFGVASRDIHFIVSSGAAAAGGTHAIIESLKGLGYVVTVVTPTQQGEMALSATVPQALVSQVFVVDIGSGNTKIAWLEAGRPATAITYGSKYFLRSVKDSLVVADVRAKAARVPASCRQTCFIIGGAPYELARTIRQGREPYTVLKSPDDYSSLDGAKTRAGLTIYRALAAATGCQQFVFSWDANFAIGYVLGKP